MGFTKLGLNEKLLKALELMHFSEPTPIQASCIPKVLAGKDVIGQSFTGSGKTAAFGLPILGKIVPGSGIQLLVLTPTRELAVQVRDHLDQMAKFLPVNIYSIYGGTGFFQQYEDIKNAEAIVATPGRLLDHLRRGTIKLHDVKFVVLDEADKML
ncbi:MAG: DEAD/DEAH box helicase, partial [archaeon]